MERRIQIETHRFRRFYLDSSIEQLEAIGVRPGDYKYLPLFEDWRQAKQRGEKVGYVVACLADRYRVSERTVYDVVKRLASDCKSVTA